MSRQTSPGPSDKAPKGTWTESSLSKLVRLKPGLFKIFIDTRAHIGLNKQFGRFCIVMVEKEGDQNDIEATDLVRAWFETAFPGVAEDQTSPSTTSKLKTDMRYHDFFHIQWSLLAHQNLREALSSLNARREKLGLSHVDLDHPSLVRPKLPDDYRDWIAQSRRKPQLQTHAESKTKTRKGTKAGGKRNLQILRRGTPTTGYKKPARRTTPGPVASLEKPPERDQDTDIWSGTLSDPPDSDWEDEPTGPEQSNEDIKPADYLDVPQTTQTVDSKPGDGGSSGAHRTLGIRSSTRIAISESLKTQTVAPLQNQQEPQLSVAPKGKSRRSKGSSCRKKRAKFKVDLVVAKLETNESDNLSVGVPLQDGAHIYLTARADTMNIDAQVPFPYPSFQPHNPGYSMDKKSSMVDAAPAPSSTFRTNDPTMNTYPPLDAPPPLEPSLTTWDDSQLTQYVRIPVWAKSRQELCELPYFKSMQGGVYTRGGTVYGYLLGRFPSPRDAWCHEGRLIVSHGGGKHVMDEGENDPGKVRHQLGDDQLESDKSVRALLTSYRMFRPVVILAEADYEPLQKFNLKQGYANQANYYALGHYAIVAAWAEKEEDIAQGYTHTRWKFAFQYIEGNQGPPWWLQPPGASVTKPEPLGVRKIPQVPRERRNFGGLVSGSRKRVSEITTKSFAGGVPSAECNECSTVSPHVYAVDPICLNPDCSSFWKHNGLPVSQAGLTFNPSFLVLRELPEQLQKIPYSIVPEYPDWQHRRTGESIFNRHYWAGACCHYCGRVSCRQKWQRWECLTCGHWRDESRPQIYDTSCLTGPMDCETQGGGIFSPHDMKSTSRVIRYDDGSSRLAIFYELPDNVGRIIHILNNTKVTQEADQLFLQYQRDASNMNMFQRHAMKAHGVKGELYAQHYSHNAGAPYKYIAEAISTPFEQCPKSVVQARDHIQYLCEPALGKKVSFNEVLSVAYAEGQEMNFHSDDEPGLGPVVAGLTLGSHADMLFRYHIAYKKNLMYKNGPFRPSEARTSDDQDSNDRVLQIVLSHGDLLIMDGIEIQKQYEHAVFVRDTDMVRFAATARLIHPRNSVQAVVPDVHPSHHARQEDAYMQDTSISKSLDGPPFAVPYRVWPELLQVETLEMSNYYNSSRDPVHDCEGKNNDPDVNGWNSSQLLN